MLKKGVWIISVLALAYFISCGGGAGSGNRSPQPIPPNEGNGNGNVAFVNSVTATATEVSPGEIVVIRAVTTAPGPTFTWTSSAGTLLSQLDGSVTAGPFSMLWWQAPTTPGTVALVTVTVNSSAGSLATSLAITINPATAVSGTWKSYNGDAENTGRSSPGAVAPNTLDVVWKIGLTAPSRAPVAVVSDGVVFAGDAAGTVVAVDAVTGSIKWTATVTGEIAASPIVGGGKVFFVTTAGEIAAFDAARGQALWGFSTGSPIFATPTYLDGLLFVGTQDGVLYALRTQKTIVNRSDRIWWTRTFQGEHIVAPIAQSQPNVLIEDARNSTVYVATREGNLYAVRAADGTILWRRQASGILLHSPAVFSLGAGRWVSVVSEDGNVYIWNAATGDAYAGRSPYLTISRAISAAPAFMDGMVFFSSRTGKLYGVDLATNAYVMSITLPENVGCFATPVLIPQGAGRLPTAFYPCFEALDDTAAPPGEFTTLRGVVYRVSQATPGAAPTATRMFATGWTNRPFYPTVQDNQDALIGAAAIHTVAVPQARGRLYFAGNDGALYGLGEPDVVPVTPPDWPTKRYSIKNDGYYEDPAGQGGGPPRGVLNLHWTQTVNSRVTGSPIVAKNMLLIGHWNKKLEAFRASDGMKLWEFLADESLRGTPTMSASGDIVFYTFSSQLIAGRVENTRFAQTVLDPSRIGMFRGDRLVIIFVDEDDDPNTPPEPAGAFQSSDLARPREDVWSAILSSAGFVFNNQPYAYRLDSFYTESRILDADGNLIDVQRSNEQKGSFFENVVTGAQLNLDDFIPTTSPVVVPLPPATAQPGAPVPTVVAAGFLGYSPNPDSSGPDFSPAVARVEIPTGRLRTRIVGSPGDFVTGIPAVNERPEYIVFMGTHNGQLIAVNPTSGSAANPIQIVTGVPALPPGAGIHGNVVIYKSSDDSPSGILLFGADDGRLYAYDYTITGRTTVNVRPRWAFVTGASIWSSPAVDRRNFVVYFGSNDKNFYAVDLFTGVELWRFTSGDRFISSPVVTGGKVFTVDEGGRIYAFGR
ncbi:MAG: outer membrane protein assembly factor BamB family protein [bacterium JZ-2024 1]